MNSALIEEYYAKIKSEADAKIETLREKPVVWIGTASCGKAAGAEKVKEAFEQAIKNNNLDVRVIEVGCMGYCYAEPLAVISKPGFPSICYGYVDEGLANRLVEDFLMGEDPCYEYALVALEPTIIFLPSATFHGVFTKKRLSLNTADLSTPAISIITLRGMVMPPWQKLSGCGRKK